MLKIVEKLLHYFSNVQEVTLSCRNKFPKEFLAFLSATKKFDFEGEWIIAAFNISAHRRCQVVCLQ